MSKEAIYTKEAPEAIGAYSQAIKSQQTVYLSGQIPLVPKSMAPVSGTVKDQIRQVFENLSAVAQAAEGSLSDVVKLTVFLTDLNHFSHVNEVMAEYFEPPYPARAVVGVAALPKGVQVEVDAIMRLPEQLF